jgi:hypothetical protein
MAMTSRLFINTFSAGVASLWSQPSELKVNGSIAHSGCSNFSQRFVSVTSLSPPSSNSGGAILKAKMRDKGSGMISQSQR